MIFSADPHMHPTPVPHVQHTISSPDTILQSLRESPYRPPVSCLSESAKTPSPPQTGFAAVLWKDEVPRIRLQNRQVRSICTAKSATTRQIPIPPHAGWESPLHRSAAVGAPTAQTPQKTHRAMTADVSFPKETVCRQAPRTTPAVRQQPARFPETARKDKAVPHGKKLLSCL